MRLAAGGCPASDVAGVAIGGGRMFADATAIVGSMSAEATASVGMRDTIAGARGERCRSPSPPPTGGATAVECRKSQRDWAG